MSSIMPKRSNLIVAVIAVCGALLGLTASVALQPLLDTGVSKQHGLPHAL
jgi:hypothetical protein